MAKTKDQAAHVQRNQTDQSLKVERSKADARVAEKRDEVEDEADEVVRVARERADQVVQTARDDADRERGAQTAPVEAAEEHERSQADVMLQRERSTADAELANERSERRRYLTDFLAMEREATDKDLVGERAFADTVIAARDEFLATVSHDLRSLVSGLSVTATVIQKLADEHGDYAKIGSHAARSQRMVSRMNRLINDLLDVTSIESGKLALLPETVEIADILHDTLAAFEPIAAAKLITLTVASETMPAHVQLDSGRILQVLANLVSNAIKFTPADGDISIQVRADGDELQFAVCDTGIGIPEHAIDQVFDRFRQVQPDRRGLGLGLHISKWIVEAHGGRLWAESTLGVGSTFHFTLPVRFAPPAAPTTA